jgi:hypothetical protein
MDHCQSPCVFQNTTRAHFLTQIPHPMQRNSDIKAILSVGLTSIHNLPVNANQPIRPKLKFWRCLPIFTTGHDCMQHSQLGLVQTVYLHPPFYILAHIFSVYTDSHRRWRFYGCKAFSPQIFYLASILLAHLVILSAISTTTKIQQTEIYNFWRLRQIRIRLPDLAGAWKHRSPFNLLVQRCQRKLDLQRKNRRKRRSVVGKVLRKPMTPQTSRPRCV